MEKKKVFQCFGLVVIVLAGTFVGALQFLTIERAFKTVEDKGGLMILYHPGRYDQPVEWYSKLFDTFNNTLIGLEVHNQGDRYKNDRLLWDEINKIRSPNDLVWGFSNDDYHRPEHSFRSYQHMLMPNLTETSLRIAMKSGASYFSYEPNGADNTSTTFGQADTPKILNVSIQGMVITVTGSNYDTIQWLNENSEVISESTSINVAEYDSNFVRAQLNNTSGITYTQPFGYTEQTIYNPYADVNWATTNHYKANFHTHTTESDGKESPSEVINRFHTAGYSILSLTDHNKNTWSWSNWIEDEPQTISKTSEFYPSLGMLAVSAIEPSDSHHFGAFFTDFAGKGTDLGFSLGF